jgi:hypothetical protein
MSFLESKVKGAIPVGRDPGGAPGFGVIVPSADGQVPVSDSSVPEGLKFVAGNSLLDPRDVFRYSMFHNVGVTGGG